MRRSFKFGAVFSMCALLGVVAPVRQSAFRGEIMDSYCAQLGSHHAITNIASTNRECTLACVKSGATFVLYDSNTRITYRLDDQRKPYNFAGEHVYVTGTYDAHTNTIHVRSIVGAPTPAVHQLMTAVKGYFARLAL
jgi:hypothetical protein